MIRHLYAHIPFCHKICPYCGFFKHQPGRANYREFVHCLIREVEWAAQRWELQLETLYFGGGTPSILPRALWRELRDGLAGVVHLEGVEEWTLEANPMTFDEEKAREWLGSGVTRVSLGVQSFADPVLGILGRDHTGEGAKAAFQDLREAGFRDVNVDLMFAVPEQSLEHWDESLDEVIELQPDHVSAYNLTYEEDTEFLRSLESGRWRQDSDRDAAYFRLAHERLTRAGWEHYEVSNYAREGHRSLHNQAYWEGRDYLGIGPGAISTVEGVRSTNVRNTELYQQRVESLGHGRDEEETLNEEGKALERLALGLRTARGVPVELLESDRLQSLTEEGLALQENGRLRLTIEGMMVADEVAGYLL